jgi:RecA-family ATPase
VTVPFVIAHDEPNLTPLGDQPFAPPALNFINASSWAGQTAKKRRWLVSARIPRATVTMLTGDGAAGKTTIGLQLGVATVRGTDWLGALIEEQGSVIFFSAEEDSDEIPRRLDAIVAHHGIDMSALAGLHCLCMPGEDAVLGAADRLGVVKPTPLFEALERRSVEIRPALIVIESAADVFAGNENDRSQVRQFVSILRRLSIKSDAAVVLIAHPSLTGMASGTGTSGSTGWNNSVRSRLYFSAARARDGDDADPDVRELKVMKSNYGPAGEVVRLRWRRGVFVPEGGIGGIERIAVEAVIDDAYLDCLDAIHGRGQQVGPYTGRAYAPSIFEKMTQAKGYRAKALAAAQERLFGAERIKVVKIGPPSKALDRIVRSAVL